LQGTNLVKAAAAEWHQRVKEAIFDYEYQQNVPMS
jgi:hypothetical protein